MTREQVIASLDVSTIPMLNGIFAPEHDELDVAGLHTFPLDGDAMIYGVRFEDGRARYYNRFMRTPVMDAKERAGRALWGGTHIGIRPGLDQVGPTLAGTDRSAPLLNVIRHANKLLALAESAPASELTRDLATVGPCTFGGPLARGTTAHPSSIPAPASSWCSATTAPSRS